MKKLKKQYKNQLLSNALVKVFNTDDITDDMILFYTKMGFGFLFEDVCDKCVSAKCKCNTIKYKGKKKDK